MCHTVCIEVIIKASHTTKCQQNIEKLAHQRIFCASCHRFSNKILFRRLFIQFKTITLCCARDIFVFRSLSQGEDEEEDEKKMTEKHYFIHKNENIPKNSYIFFCDNNNWQLWVYFFLINNHNAIITFELFYTFDWLLSSRGSEKLL